ncbi:hypothetical protein TELCIR_17658, partial [Teladorsagia circumcincta]
MYSLGANINFYMIHGGTNFGFWSGSEAKAPGKYRESYMFRKKAFGVVKMEPVDDLTRLGNEQNCITSSSPMSFEKIGQPFGFVLYKREMQSCGYSLNITLLKDFGYVYMNKNHLGTFVNSFNGQSKRSVDLKGCTPGDTLQILVENQGRQTYETINDYKEMQSCGYSLNITLLKDFGYVYMNKNHLGTFVNSFNGQSKRSVDLKGCTPGDTLQILVENQGRQTYETINDYKGILSDVKMDNTILSNWTQCKLNLVGDFPNSFANG